MSTKPSNYPKFEFYEECASQWYSRLQEKEKGLMKELNDSLANRPHLFLDSYTRKEYQDRAETFNKMNALVPSEALYTLDNYIARTFYDATPAAEILAPVTSVNAGKAQESKTYAGSDMGTAKLVGAHNKWNDPPMIGMSLTPTFVKALGVHAAYELSFSEIDEGGLYDIEWYFALKCGEKVGTLYDQKLMLGEGAADAEIDTTAVDGIHNYTGVQTCKWGVGDNVITTQGDLIRGLFTALVAMKSTKEPGDNILITTSGVHAEAVLQRDTYGVTDLDIIKRDFFAPGYIKEWWVDDHMEATTMAANTQRAMLLKRGITTCKLEKVYPLQSKLMATEFPDDVKTMLMVMDVFKYYNAEAAVICDGDITATTLGFAPNGRVL